DVLGFIEYFRFIVFLSCLVFRGSTVFFCLLISETLPMCVFLLFHFKGVTIILRGEMHFILGY
ncbi:hypothetical protein GIB67_023229, partial [Kingdonia uniflora]